MPLPEDAERLLTPAERIESSPIPATAIVLAAAGYLALHFGLGDSGIEVLRIRWPDGLEESFTNLTPNQEWFHRHP